jgi:hypothetical protein
MCDRTRVVREPRGRNGAAVTRDRSMQRGCQCWATAGDDAAGLRPAARRCSLRLWLAQRFGKVAAPVLEGEAAVERLHQRLRNLLVRRRDAPGLAVRHADAADGHGCWRWLAPFLLRARAPVWLLKPKLPRQPLFPRRSKTGAVSIVLRRETAGAPALEACCAPRGRRWRAAFT